MSKDNIDVTDVLWGGQKVFGYGTREPWIGIKRDKLAGLKQVDITVSGLKTAPLYSGVDAEAFLSLSEAHGWTKKMRGQQIDHVPLSELKKLAQSTKE